MTHRNNEVAWITVTNAILLLVGIVGSVIASRALGPHDRGVFVSWQVWATTIGVLASLALPQYLVTGREITWGAAWSAGLTSSLIGASAVVTLLAINGAPGSAMLGGAAIAVSNTMSGVRASWMQRTGQLRVNFNAQRAAPQVAGLSAMLVLVMSSERDVEAWLVWVGFSQIAASLAVGSLLGARPVLRLPSSELLRESAKLVPISWLSLLQSRIDLLVVSALYPPAEVAFYSVAAAIQSAVVAVGQSVSMRWFSRHKEAPAITAAKQTAALSVAAAAIAMLACWPAVAFGYGPAFLPAVPLALVLCIGAVPRNLDYLISHVAMARGTYGRLTPIKSLLVLGVILAIYGVWLGGGSVFFAVVAVTALGALGGLTQLFVISRKSGGEE